MNPKTAAKWVEAYPIIQKTKALAVVAKYAEGKHKAALRVLLDAPKKTKIRIPRGTKTPQAVKKDIKAELEALCKAIVFTRDCGSPEARAGLCISCSRWNEKLQWGHFIRQQDSKWLQYDPRNTGGQCAGCNGFAAGNVLNYADAIDKRDGHGAALCLRQEAEYMDAHWRPNKTTLSEMLRKLRLHPLAPKAERPVSETNRNNPIPSNTQDSPTKGTV